MSDRKKKEQAEHRDAPASDELVTYRRGKSRGLSLVRALVGHGDTRPSRVAEIIAQHPADQDDVMAFIQDYFGNSFANKVLHAMPAARRAEKVNHDLGDYVDKEDRDELSGDEHGDPNRLTDKGHRASVDASAEDPVPVVRNDGSVIGTITDPDQKLRIDAGTTSKIAVKDEDGEPTECVLAYRIKLSDDRAVAGWVPVDGLGDDAHTREIKKDNRRIANSLKRRRTSAKNASTWRVNLAADTSRFEGLFVRSKQDTENKAEHYCKRPLTDVVNLVSHIPNSGGSRFGVPCDVLVDGTTFHRIDNVAKGHTPLYLPNSEQQSPHFLTFVYGYSTNSAGTRTYGWLNEAMIVRADAG